MRRPDDWDKRQKVSPTSFFISITEVLTFNAEAGRVVGEWFCVMKKKEKTESKYLYHYTSLKSAISILGNGENGNLCFWGTRYDSMEDTEDFTYARDKVIPLLLKSLDESTFDEKEREDSEIYPYIVSFSEIEDDPNMWSIYNAEVALELNYSAILEEINRLNGSGFKYSFGKCKYPKTDDELHLCFTELYNQSDDLTSIPITARYQTAFIKREKYEYEHEIRLFTCDYASLTASYNNGDPIFSEIEISEHVKTRTSKSGKLIRYKDFHLPQKTLNGLIINMDNNSFEKEKRNLKSLLSQLGYNSQQMDIRQAQNASQSDFCTSNVINDFNDKQL